MATIEELEAEVKRLREALSKQDDDICQTLGKALGYPWFKDDQANFPGATKENGVCVGDHVAESIAMAAAAWLDKYHALTTRLNGLTVTLTEGKHDGVAYLSFLAPGEILAGVSVRHTDAGSGMILDWNAENQLIGIEFLNTSRLPPREGRNDGAKTDG